MPRNVLKTAEWQEGDYLCITLIRCFRGKSCILYLLELPQGQCSKGNNQSWKGLCLFSKG